MSRASRRLPLRFAHSLLEESTLEKGEVSLLEASSMALCTELSCFGAGTPVLACVPVVAPGISLASCACWRPDALFVSLIANSAKDAITIRQIATEASLSKRTIEVTTTLD